VTNSQLFAFKDGDEKKPIALTPQNGNGKLCFNINKGLLDESACDATKPAASQLFTFGDATAAGSATAANVTATETAANATATGAASETAAKNATAVNNTTTGNNTVTLAATGGASQIINPNPNIKCGQQLDQKAVDEAMQKDNTATRALTGVPIKAADGSCLFVDKTCGDFRENLIPIQTAKCDGSAGQQFDVITKGKHNNVAGQALIVSSLVRSLFVPF
jgi:hypothetical protein